MTVAVKLNVWQDHQRDSFAYPDFSPIQGVRERVRGNERIYNRAHVSRQRTSRRGRIGARCPKTAALNANTSHPFFVVIFFHLNVCSIDFRTERPEWQPTSRRQQTHVQDHAVPPSAPNPPRGANLGKSRVASGAGRVADKAIGPRLPGP